MTGQPLASVVQASGAEYRALEAEAEAARWTDMHELAALQVELLHAIYRALAGAFGKGNPPEPLRVPRPNDPRPGEIRVTAGQLAGMLRRRGARRGG
jgi:hypothetical protein